MSADFDRIFQDAEQQRIDYEKNKDRFAADRQRDTLIGKIFDACIAVRKDDLHAFLGHPPSAEDFCQVFTPGIVLLSCCVKDFGLMERLDAMKLPAEGPLAFIAAVIRKVGNGELAGDELLQVLKRAYDEPRLAGFHDLYLNELRYVLLQQVRPQELFAAPLMPAAAPNPPPSPPPDKPAWDEATRSLIWKGKPIKVFRKHPAENQAEVIGAFHEAQWDTWVANPFRLSTGFDKRKLVQTLSDLNANLPPKTIHFRADGRGEGVIWEPA